MTNYIESCKNTAELLLVRGKKLLEFLLNLVQFMQPCAWNENELNTQLEQSLLTLFL